ncbi:MAG: hypothetical protein ACN4GW_08560 [Desulforhopalus sp.]
MIKLAQKLTQVLHLRSLIWKRTEVNGKYARFLDFLYPLGGTEKRDKLSAVKR